MIKNCNNFCQETLKYLCNFHFTGASILNPSEVPVILGSWDRAQKYALDIMEVCLYIKLINSYFKPKYILASFWTYFTFQLINKKRF